MKANLPLLAALLACACAAPESEDRAADSDTIGSVGEVIALPVPPDLLQLEWLRERQLAQTAEGAPSRLVGFRFTDRLEESGITFRHRVVPDAGVSYKAVHYDHGNGLAVADVDGDGALDLYFTTQVGRNELWRNIGEGRFEDWTETAGGVGLADRISVSASFADIDNDGDPDLFVTTVRGGNALFENDGAGSFRDITSAAGVAYTGHSSGADFFDYDRDGLLDLFVVNVGRYTGDVRAPAGDGSYYVGLEDAFSGHLHPDRAEVSLLYHNEGQNRFRDVTEETGLVDERWSGDATPVDANHDGWPDLYVLSMQGQDGYWENDRGQRFVSRGAELFSATPWGAMGVKVVDYDNDGRQDILITDMHSDMWETDQVDRFVTEEGERRKPTPARVPPVPALGIDRPAIYGNALFHAEPDGSFTDVADAVGFETYWPWGLSSGDLNADGWEDVFQTASMNFPFRYQVNALLLNDGGTRFRRAEFLLGVEPRRGGRVAGPWFEMDCEGEDREHPMCAASGSEGRFEILGALGSRSSAVFDLDEDGDLDIITNDFNSAPMVLVSDLADRRPIRYLKVRLIGLASNRDGLGAVVTVSAGGARYTRVHDGQSGYLSQSAIPLYLGLADAEVVDQVEILWPSGREQVIEGPVEPNQSIELREPR